MPDPIGRLASRIVALLDDVPEAAALAFARELGRAGPGRPTALADLVVRSTPSPQFRVLLADLLREWEAVAPAVGSETVAAMLVAAARAHAGARDAQRVELVWTGPETGAAPYRHTEQALLEVVGCAIDTLTVVSYAVYNVPTVGRALVAAAERGVRLRIVLETPHKSDSERAYDTVRALGKAVAERCAVYYWPMEQRVAGTGGKQGILHAKAAVADSRCLFLSSANLTEYAFTVNIELGVLVHGGALPRQVQERVESLIQDGVLLPL